MMKSELVHELKLSLRDLVIMMADRRISVTHTTIPAVGAAFSGKRFLAHADLLVPEALREESERQRFGGGRSVFWWFERVVMLLA